MTPASIQENEHRVLIEVLRREVHSDLPAVVETDPLGVIAMDLLLSADVTVRPVSVAMVAATVLRATAGTAMDLRASAEIVTAVLRVTAGIATVLQVMAVEEIVTVLQVSVAIGRLVTEILTVVTGSSVHQLKEVTTTLSA